MVIETYNLTKHFNGRIGCQDICLSVAEGQVFGLLGPNGAGKSTLVKTLVGLLHPTSGRALLLGRPLGDLEARRNMGFLPENFRYHEWMTGHDLLSFHGALYGMTPRAVKARIPEVLALVGLQGRERDRVGSYSKGMQQRIGIACALLPDPRLLFLDEPTSALDPLGRREIREIIFGLKRKGKTIFLNSHLLSEVEMVCDEVAFIKKGKIVAAGRLDEITAGPLRLSIRLGEMTPAVREALVSFDPRVSFDPQKTDPESCRAELTVRNPDEVPALARAVVQAGGLLYELTPARGSLEDLFVQLAKEESS